jgi:hypothetical protein
MMNDDVCLFVFALLLIVDVMHYSCLVLFDCCLLLLISNDGAYHASQSFFTSVWMQQL